MNPCVFQGIVQCSSPVIHCDDGDDSDETSELEHGEFFVTNQGPLLRLLFFRGQSGSSF